MTQPGAQAGYLVTEKLVKRFDDAVAVDEVSLSIGKGEIFALLGSSGCGKSTLLRMLAGFEKPTSGRILLGGQDVAAMAPYDRPVNMMFQSYALFPHLNIWENVAFGLKREGLPKAEVQKRTDEMLALVQLTPYAKRKPHQLSGGQQQRVALARSLAKKPKLLLLDEPLGALDKKLREQTQFELVNIIEQVGVTVVMVTHDQEEAMTMASRIAIMSKGRVLQVGTPEEIYEHPRNKFVADFIGNVNLFAGTLTVDEPDRCAVTTALGEMHVGHGVSGTLNMPVTLAVRPEKIEVSKTRPDANINVFHGAGQGNCVLRLVQHLHRQGQRRFQGEDHRSQHLSSRVVRHHVGGHGVLLVERQRRRRVARLTPKEPMVSTPISMPGKRFVIGVPYVWLFVFFFLPFLILLYISFVDMGESIHPFKPIWDVETGLLSLKYENYTTIFKSEEGGGFRRFISRPMCVRSGTPCARRCLCLVLGYPFAYFIARSPASVRPALLMMVMLPFWTSFLLRVYAWKGILADQGVLNQMFMARGLDERADTDALHRCVAAGGHGLCVFAFHGAAAVRQFGEDGFPLARGRLRPGRLALQSVLAHHGAAVQGRHHRGFHVGVHSLGGRVCDPLALGRAGEHHDRPRRMGRNVHQQQLAPRHGLGGGDDRCDRGAAGLLLPQQRVTAGSAWSTRDASLS